MLTGTHHQGTQVTEPGLVTEDGFLDQARGGKVPVQCVDVGNTEGLQAKMARERAFLGHWRLRKNCRVHAYEESIVRSGGNDEWLGPRVSRRTILPSRAAFSKAGFAIQSKINWLRGRTRPCVLWGP